MLRTVLAATRVADAVASVEQPLVRGAHESAATRRHREADLHLLASGLYRATKGPVQRSNFKKED